MANKIRRIEVSFPVEVELPLGWDRALDALVGMVCEAYEAANPTRVMWPAGHGSKIGNPMWQDPPTFDDSIYAIDVAEREGSERELERRARRRG